MTKLDKMLSKQWEVDYASLYDQVEDMISNIDIPKGGESLLEILMSDPSIPSDDLDAGNNFKIKNRLINSIMKKFERSYTIRQDSSGSGAGADFGAFKW